MFKIYDGRQAFYQWDLNQRVIVEDKTITQVHFCNRTDDCALICETYEHNGLLVADVPNILLQDNWRIRVYAYDGNATKHEQRFDVTARSKPDSYVYTETEVLNYETIKDRMDAIEGNLTGVAEEIIREYLEENEFDVDLTGYATEEFVNTAIEQIELLPGPKGDPGPQGIQGVQGIQGPAGKDGVDGKNGKDGTNGKDGYTPVKGVDYFDGKDGKDGKDGQDGYTPVKGVDYFDGKDGAPGKDGADGAPGAQGPTGPAGADGKDYVLTYADKQEIAGMVEVTGGGGSGDAIEEVYIGTEEPTKTSVKIWVDPDEKFTVNVDGTTIIQNEDGTISAALGGGMVLAQEPVLFFEASDATGWTKANSGNSRYATGLADRVSYMLRAKKYIIDIEYRNATTGETGSSTGEANYTSKWVVKDLKVFDDEIRDLGHTTSGSQGLYLNGTQSGTGYYQNYYITKLVITQAAEYTYNKIDGNYIGYGDGLTVDADGNLVTTNGTLVVDSLNNIIQKQNTNGSSQTSNSDGAMFGMSNSFSSYCNSGANILIGRGNNINCAGAVKVLIGDDNKVTSGSCPGITMLGMSNQVTDGRNSSFIGYGNKFYGPSTNIKGGYNTFVGYDNTANNLTTACFAAGNHLIVGYNNQTVYGTGNLSDTTGAYNVIIGNSLDTTNRANGLTIAPDGSVVTQGTISNGGADYAEYFEWVDGNPENEDRVGLLVTLEGNKIRLASGDDDILGIVSGTATVLGDDAEWVWQGKYLRDNFGRLIMEEVEIFREDPVYNEEGEIVGYETVSNGFTLMPKINPNYNKEQEYTSRAKRAEWDAIGMMGKLFLQDDGTCVVNGYAQAGTDGVATAATGKTNMRVMERIDENIIRVCLK